jgi:hypothetical protein
VADVLELTFVRADLIVPLASSTVYPTPLDYANDHTRPDHLLWFFPFLPDRVATGDPAVLGGRAAERSGPAHIRGGDASYRA